MNKIIVAFVAAPQLALASGLIVGALAWLITLPFNSVLFTILVAVNVLLGGLARPWLAYRRWKINHQPRFNYGGSMQDYTAYVKAKETFDSRQRKIARPLKAWTLGITTGFFPLTFLNLLS